MGIYEAVHGDPFSDKGMSVNQMNNMVFGSPTPFSLPIGCLRLRHGGMVNGGMIKSAINHAMGYPLEKRPNLVRQGLKLANGGKVQAYKGRPPGEIVAVMKTAGVDNIPALLQGGELVIPKKDVPKVSKMLRKEKIVLPGM